VSTTPETALLAQCVYELRLLLASMVGSTATADRSVRVAAHLVYALHDQAEETLAGNSFDVEEAIKQVAASVAVVDVASGEYLVSQLRAAVRDSMSQQEIKPD